MGRRLPAWLLGPFLIIAWAFVAGCARQPSIVGRWTMTGARTDGAEVSLSELVGTQEHEVLGAFLITIDFREDGTASASAAGEDLGVLLTYAADGDRVVVEGDGEPMLMTLDAQTDTLTWENPGMTDRDTAIIFTRDGA